MNLVSSGVIFVEDQQNLPLAVDSLLVFSVNVEPDNADEATLLKQDKRKNTHTPSKYDAKIRNGIHLCQVLSSHVESQENKKLCFYIASLAHMQIQCEAYSPETQHGRRVTKVYMMQYWYFEHGLPNF